MAAGLDQICFYYNRNLPCRSGEMKRAMKKYMSEMGFTLLKNELIIGMVGL